MDTRITTICNRLNRVHSNTGLDVWYKHQLEGVKYKINEVTSVQGTITSMSQSFTILIPVNPLYLPYDEWKDEVDKTATFTLSQGDYIFLDVDLSDEIVNANTIITLKNSYKSKACEVRSIMEVPTHTGIQYQLKVGGI